MIGGVQDDPRLKPPQKGSRSPTLDLLGLPLPPSLNKLYFNARGRRHLSASGRVFKHKVKVAVLEQLIHYPDFMANLDCPLSLKINLYFDTLENKGWLQGKTLERYKRIDVSNRVKVLEDVLAEALNIDDKMFFTVEVTKFQLPPNAVEGVDAYISKRLPGDFLLGLGS